MIVVDKLLVGGLRFVFDKVAQAADAEMSSPDRLREELLAAQLQLELGEISDDEFAAIEEQVIRGLRDLRQAGEGAGGPISFGDVAEQPGVEISFGGDEDDDA